MVHTCNFLQPDHDEQTFPWQDMPFPLLFGDTSSDMSSLLTVPAKKGDGSISRSVKVKPHLFICSFTGK